MLIGGAGLTGHRVALVQNQSEMAHYSYADASRFLRDLGYQVELFTAFNVHELERSLVQDLDAVVLASNSLNDKTIRRAFATSTLPMALEDFLASGKGLVSFHQLGLASSDLSTLEFLPANLREVRARSRPPEERSADGVLAIHPAHGKHLALNYPHDVDADSIAKNALQFRSLPGLYWHYWTGNSEAYWDTLVVDRSGSSVRPLILCTKGDAQCRVVLSALTLDWQRADALLENVLRYTVEGQHRTALLTDGRTSSAAFEFLTETLSSRRFPFRRYDFRRDTEPLKRYIDEGMHRTVVLAPQLSFDSLDEELQVIVDRAIDSGQLRVIDMTSSPSGTGRFTVRGRQRYAQKLLHDLELEVQAELRHGYIDGSFWSTVETLQSLTALSRVSGAYRDFVAAAIELMDTHDRDGSYDEVFGATCAALWIRAEFLGPSHEKTERTASWIRRCIDRYDDRERALAFRMLAVHGLLLPEERQRISAILVSVGSEHLSLIDLVSYLRAALAIGHSPAIAPLVMRLCERVTSDGWPDLATAAEAAIALLDAAPLVAREHLGTGPSGEVRHSMDSVLHEAIILIQDAVARTAPERYTPKGGRYPWDGKASTSAKCIEAWLKFDELQDMPVYEVVDSIQQFHRDVIGLESSRTALQVLDDLKATTDELQEELTQANARLLRAAVAEVAARRRTLMLLGTVYILVALSAAIFWSSARSGIGIVASAFVHVWPFHLTVGALALTALAVPWERWFRRQEGQ